MRCVTPITFKSVSKDGLPTNKTVPCGKCYACLYNKQQDWVFRMQQEMSISKISYFVTLTYAPGCEPITLDEHMTLNKKDWILFLKRFRKSLSKHSAKCRFFMCGEYGPQTLRPHYHAILFFDTFFDKETITKLLDSSWNNGFICVEDATPKSCAYVAKYILKGSKFYEDCLKPFVLMSRNPGIGSSFAEDEKNQEFYKDKLFTVLKGYKKRLPRYYTEKLYQGVLLPNSTQLYDTYSAKYKNLSPYSIYQTISENIKLKEKRNIKKLKL